MAMNLYDQHPSGIHHDETGVCLSISPDSRRVNASRPAQRDLERKSDVDAYVAKLKAELITAIRAGHIARIQ